MLAGEGRSLESEEMIAFWRDWTARYPIVSIEDGLAEDDWKGWCSFTRAAGEGLQIVGDEDGIDLSRVRVRRSAPRSAP